MKTMNNTLENILKESKELIHDFYSLGSDGKVYAHPEKLQGFLIKACKEYSMSLIPEVERSHTMGSENAEVYRAYDNGFNNCRQEMIDNINQQ